MKVSDDLAHSWENQFAHIVRQRGKVRRCRIGKMRIADGEVSIAVEFREAGTDHKVGWFTKTVSPLHLLFANHLWTSNESVLSESETEEDGCEGRALAHENDVTLPLLDCHDTAKLSDLEKRKLKWMVIQVNNFRCLMNEKAVWQFE